LTAVPTGCIMPPIILHYRKMIGGDRGKEKDTMSSAEGQLRSEAKVNGAQEEATSRIFALDLSCVLE
jgi:hypothetical protein